MVSEMIDAVKNAEESWLEKQKNAQRQAELIVEKANNGAKKLIEEKAKDANSKAELRINFAKKSAEEILQKGLEQSQNNVKLLKENALKLKNKAIKEVVDLLIN